MEGGGETIEICITKQYWNHEETYHSLAIVASKVLVTDGHEAPESLFCRHMHKQKCSQWGLSLAIANSCIQNRIGF